MLLHRIIVSYLSGGLSVCTAVFQFDSVSVFSVSVFSVSVCKVQCSVFQCRSVAACLVCIGWAEHKVVIPANFTF